MRQQMKQRLGWIGNPSLHLIVLATVLAGAVMAFNSPSSWSHRKSDPAHPAGCHACSLCPPQVAADRDAYLIRAGGIAPDESE